jgi:Lon protease-like protein
MRRITALPYAASVLQPLALFPLNTPLVPGLVLPLHIFEPRYRELVSELLAVPDEDAREFGIVAIRDGGDVLRDGMDALYPIGTATVLREAESLPDGRYDIVTCGTRRFRIADVDMSRPLLRAMVEFLPEDEAPADALLAIDVARRFRDYRAALAGQVDEHDDADGDGIPADPTVLSYLITAAMILPQHERQALLSAATTATRLTLARTLLNRETGLITQLGSVPALELPGATPSVN